MARAAPTMSVPVRLDKHPVCFLSTITTLIHARPSPSPRASSTCKARCPASRARCGTERFQQPMLPRMAHTQTIDLELRELQFGRESHPVFALLHVVIWFMDFRHACCVDWDSRVWGTQCAFCPLRRSSRYVLCLAVGALCPPPLRWRVLVSAIYCAFRVIAIANQQTSARFVRMFSNRSLTAWR